MNEKPWWMSDGFIAFMVMVLIIMIALGYVYL